MEQQLVVITAIGWMDGLRLIKIPYKINFEPHVSSSQTFWIDDWIQLQPPSPPSAA